MWVLKTSWIRIRKALPRHDAKSWSAASCPPEVSSYYFQQSPDNVASNRSPHTLLIHLVESGSMSRDPVSTRGHVSLDVSLVCCCFHQKLPPVEFRQQFLSLFLWRQVSFICPRATYLKSHNLWPHVCEGTIVKGLVSNLISSSASSSSYNSN